MCVGQRDKAGEERVVLFLKLNKDVEFTQELIRRLAQSIRSQLSARHVPSVILPISEIPVGVILYTYFVYLVEFRPLRAQLSWTSAVYDTLQGVSITY